MPNKWLNDKGVEIKKQKHKVFNWSEYNTNLKRRGDIEVWLSQDVIDNWYFDERVYNGTGSSKRYTNDAIIACHQIRQVFKLPLRQTQGFINSLFRIMNLPLTCPDYTTLSRRLSELNIKSPRYVCPRGYTKHSKMDENIAAIALDSTGLKRFGRDEWHQEKHKVSARRSWRKAHFGIDENHYIQAAVLTGRFTHDDEVVDDLLGQINSEVDHFTADGAYDESPVYDKLSAHSPSSNIVIPPAKNAVVNSKAHQMRNRNIGEINESGRMAWQRHHNYGQRNYSELAVQRYKRILGRAMHAREMNRQSQEFVIGCGVLNKMTSLGMPVSSKIA
tara:strand:- start:43 stop:1038 length:996 start_codon:yes stop_codon:yes gene_type:complete